MQIFEVVAIQPNIINKLSAKDKRFLDTIAKQFIKSLFTNGDLKAQDLSLSTEKFAEKVKALTDKVDIKVIIDHRDRIINEANYFFEKGEKELAKIMYAMYFEHSINGIINNFCTRKKIDEKTKTEIIKSIDIHSKLTWLLKIFEYPIFNEFHRKTIKRVSEDRNAFIHYKWKSKEEANPNKANINSEEFKKIKQAVTYMKFYEAKVEFNKSKKKLEHRLKAK